MKKYIALLLVAVMSLALLTACGNTVYDEFENYINVEVAKVNENYTKVTEEAGKWAEFEEDAQLVASINDTMLPLVEESLEILGKIAPESEEVKDIHNKYIKVWDAYKEGFTLVLEGFEAQDEEKVAAGNEKLTEGISNLDEYNAALNALAEELGGEIEY